jgi:small conductance mechanosensitive channel
MLQEAQDAAQTAQDTTQAAQNTAADAAQAANATPSPSDGFGELVTRVSEGDMSSETWILAWETIGQPVLLALVLIVAVFLVAGWARGLTKKACNRAKTEETLARFLSNVVRYLILIAGGIMILGTLGIETASFAAVLAAAGFAIGMAMSGMLGNIAAGVMLLLFRPFKVGHYIKAAGTEGTVDEIGLFTTTLDTPDKRRIIVPNSSIFGDNIENVSFHPIRRVAVAVGTDYGADIDKARETLMACAKNCEFTLQDPEPAVVLTGLGGSSIDWSVRIWVNASDFWPANDRLTRDVKYALDNADIGIPFPQMDVHIDGGIKRD